MKLKMVMTEIKHSLLVMLLCISLPALTQKVDTISIATRVKNLEEYRENLDKLYELKSEELNKTVSEKIADKTKDLDEANKTLKLLMLIGIPATLGGLLIVYFGATMKARKIMIEKIEKIVEHKREEIIRLIETQEFDTKLRRTKKLMVLSSTEEAQEAIKPFFSKVKFENVHYRIVNSYQDFNEYDLIIFNDHHSPFNDEIIQEYLDNAQNEDTTFVAYTSRQLKRDHRMNFSNNKFTLYHSILSTLKYAELLKLTA